MTDTLTQLVRDASPITDARAQGLTLDDVEAELCAAILLQPRPERSARRRRPLGWRLSGLVAAGAAAVAALAIGLTGGGERLGPGADRAWGAPALRVANAVPRLLVGAPGWTITRADEFTVDDGEMTFRDGRRGVDLHWHSGPSGSLVADRANTARELPSADVLGSRARVFRYEGPYDDFTAIWRHGSYTLELRTALPLSMSLEEYRRVLTSLETVGVDDWLAAMPPNVVLPVDADRVVAEMLEGVPLPAGLDRRAWERTSGVRDRYQLGAVVTSAVACGWIEQWLEARRTGDAAAAAAAVEAMRTSHRWPILREMQAEGEWSEVLWSFADAMRRNAPIPAGKPTSVEQGYRSALGC